MSDDFPRASMRLQFHPGFTLDDAAALVPYLADLGISHVYASPLFAARRGSRHGYDVVDYGKINPELGGRAALARLARALAEHRMGIVLDIVPNHMAADARDNAWWRDVLRRGRASSYARFFDIDWRSAEPRRRGKILLPILGKPCADALAAHEIHLVRSENGTEIAYYEQRFPIAPSTDPALIAKAESNLDALRTLLEQQHYRLATWKIAGDAINWRRFFEVAGLVALNAERADVFAATHKLVLELFAEGVIAGVRVDHIDGLAEPARYCRRLRRALVAAGRARGARPYIVVEKILAGGEALPAGWRVDGSTGYDFMDQVSAVLHDPRGAAPLSRLWQRYAEGSASFLDVAMKARRALLDERFAADFDRMLRAFSSAPESTACGLPHRAIGRMLRELVSRFPAYRMYPEASGNDLDLLDRTIAAAGRGLGRSDRAMLPRLRAMLLAPAHRRGTTRFGQLTATIAAKAVEDTAFYRYGRLLSRNEVGASPEIFSLSPTHFHALLARRVATFPHTLLATATHDQKRGEDVRARLAVLSEIPNEWAAIVACWAAQNSARAIDQGNVAVPGRADELMLYQMLVAAWPAALDPRDTAGVRAFGERLALWQEKAVREAKLHSDWLAIDQEYENACRVFLFGMLDDEAFRAEIARVARRIGPAGAVNGLAQTMLRLTTPGVPDLYQGTEFWDESLVDPDNRRRVDFAARAAALTARRPLAELLDDWQNGHIKQALIARLLGLRRRAAELFASGSYHPLEAKGGESPRSLFFLRGDESTSMLVGVVRLSVPLLGLNSAPKIAAEAWDGAELTFPEAPRGPWYNALEERGPCEGGKTVPLGVLFDALPVACWITGKGFDD